MRETSRKFEFREIERHRNRLTHGGQAGETSPFMRGEAKSPVSRLSSNF
jgi:hypothetical protein